MLAVFDDGSVERVAGGGAFPDGPRTNGVPARASIVVGSGTRSCVIWQTGDAECTGSASTKDWWPASSRGDVVGAGLLAINPYACGILRNGRVLCPTAGDRPWNNDVVQSTRFVRLGQPAVAITSGAFGFFCAALRNGEVKCWPTSDSAQLTTYGLGGILPTATEWPSVDLGHRPAR